MSGYVQALRGLRVAAFGLAAPCHPTVAERQSTP